MLLFSPVMQICSDYSFSRNFELISKVFSRAHSFSILVSDLVSFSFRVFWCFFGFHFLVVFILIYFISVLGIYLLDAKSVSRVKCNADIKLVYHWVGCPGVYLHIDRNTTVPFKVQKKLFDFGGIPPMTPRFCHRCSTDRSWIIKKFRK